MIHELDIPNLHIFNQILESGFGTSQLLLTAPKPFGTIEILDMLSPDNLSYRVRGCGFFNIAQGVICVSTSTAGEEGEVEVVEMEEEVTNSSSTGPANYFC